MLSNDIKNQHAIDNLLQVALGSIEKGQYNRAKSCIRRARERLGFEKFMNDLSGASMCPLEELEDIIFKL